MQTHKLKINLFNILVVLMILIAASALVWQYQSNLIESTTSNNDDVTAASQQETISEESTPSVILGEAMSEQESKFSIDADRLLAKDTVMYLDPYSGATLKFERTQIIQNTNSKTIMGSVTIAGQARPMTVTISPDQIFMSVPLLETTYSGSGPHNNVVLKRNKPVNDRIKHETPPQVTTTTVAAREITDKCLNCD